LRGADRPDKEADGLLVRDETDGRLELDPFFRDPVIDVSQIRAWRFARHGGPANAVVVAAGLDQQPAAIIVEREHHAGGQRPLCEKGREIIVATTAGVSQRFANDSGRRDPLERAQLLLHGLAEPRLRRRHGNFGELAERIFTRVARQFPRQRRHEQDSHRGDQDDAAPEPALDRPWGQFEMKVAQSKNLCRS
jgi:hypothetical protein